MRPVNQPDGTYCVDTDAMLPDYRRKDTVFYARPGRFTCDGVYVLNMGHGPFLRRCMTFYTKKHGPHLLAFADNKKGKHAKLRMSRQEFEAACLGRVFGVYREEDVVLQREAGIVGFASGSAPPPSARSPIGQVAA